MNNQKLAQKLAEWHGGQWSALYAVQCALSEGIIPRKSLLEDAIRELQAEKNEECNFLSSQLKSIDQATYFPVTYHISEGRGKNRITREETRLYQRLSLADCKALSTGARVDFIARQGAIKQVTVTSVKTWKTRADVRLGLKYGLYEHSYTECNVSEWGESWSGEILVKEVENDQN